eukprot:5221320-Prorocentrum_lima.AAC.1
MREEGETFTEKWAAYYSWKRTREARIGLNDYTVRAVASDAGGRQPRRPFNSAPKKLDRDQEEARSGDSRKCCVAPTNVPPTITCA